MGKRRDGEGTIYTDKNGDTWVQLSAGPNGHRPRKKVLPGVDPVEFKRQLEGERASGRDPSRKAETVSALLDVHLETAEAAGRRPSTILGYRNNCQHIRERIGAMKISDVTHEVVQNLANAMARAGVGPTAVRKALEALKAAYDPIVPDRVSRNPVDFKKLRLRRHTPAEKEPLEDGQVTALLAAVDDVETMGRYARYAMGVWLMALLGMRRGEACGARWIDVNWERGELRIRQQLSKQLDGGYAPGEIKTPAGVRVILLGPRFLARLREVWEHRQLERKRPGWKEHGYILAHEDGSPVRPDFLNHVLNKLDGRSGQPHINPHLLRHTAATIISEEGYSDAVIAAVLGHGKRGAGPGRQREEQGPAITRRYVHAREQARRAAVLAVETRVLGAVEEGQRGAV